MYSQKFFLFSFHCFQIRLPSSCLCYIWCWICTFEGQILEDKFAAIFCSFERTPSNTFNFSNPDINKFILQTLQNYLQEFSKQSRNSSFLTLTCLRVVWRAVLFQNHMEVRFVPAMTRGFFFASSLACLLASFRFFRKEKKSLWHPGYIDTGNEW